MSQHSIIFDATHLILRQPVSTPTGIDRVDQAYASYFSMPGTTGRMSGGIVTSGFGKVSRRVSTERVSRLAAALSDRWGEEQSQDADPIYGAFRDFIFGKPNATNAASQIPSLSRRIGEKSRGTLNVAANLLKNDEATELPDGAIYLNVTQNPVLVPRAATWLKRHPDLRPVFLVHDLIPIDFPEYFARDRLGQFRAVLSTIFDHAAALITTTEVVKARIQEELKRNSRRNIPVLVASLPMPSGFDQHVACDPELTGSRYVAMVGTVEPRKNHWLILNLWNQMVAAGDDPPKLVIIGAKGWQNENVERMIESAPNLKHHVIHLSGLSNSGLRKIVGHARAQLMPSFAEGYGIPVIEALSLGTPIIASDISVFQEVSQGTAVLVGPLDGPGWRREILRLAGPASHERSGKLEPLTGFRPPQVDDYFESVRTFLHTL